MQPIKISTAQFENKSGDKNYNLSVIESLAQKAAQEGSDVIAFHECSLTGYTFARKLSPRSRASPLVWLFEAIPACILSSERDRKNSFVKLVPEL